MPPGLLRAATRLGRLRARPNCPGRRLSGGVGPAPAAASARPQLVLGIETSCDDTAAAVVSVNPARVVGEAASSQGRLHAGYGGVVPRLAALAHASAVDGVVARALAAAGVDRPGQQLAAVAVTLGPGLAMCLRVGVAAARKLAHAHALPIVYVHHMEAHALVGRLSPGGGLAGTVAFPFVALLVSGGHTLLVLVNGVGRHTLLGGTLDDALGEALDKTARLLGLDLGGPGGGGAALEALARSGDPSRFPFAKPLRGSPQHASSCELSYAGLKTAARLAIARELGPGGGADPPPFPAPPPPPPAAAAAADGAGGDYWAPPRRAAARADLAASFQASCFDHLAERTARALAWARDAAGPACATLVLSGGCASNAALRARLAGVAKRAGYALAVPPPALCTDNGAMVAWAGAERLALGLASPPPARLGEIDADGIEHVEGLRPRWDLGERCAASAAALAGARGLRTRAVAAPLTAEAEAPAG